MRKLGIVVIGRNEGERLHRCLRSVVGEGRLVVYVDSGSTDDSLAFAESLSVVTVQLDTKVPFTAARARNAGLARLFELADDFEFVQFVDGDCEVHTEWVARAIAEFASRIDAAVICGRRRERHPDASVYNRLCDMEWDTPIGEAKACGGDAMFRASILRQVGGYDPSLIAGEEPELCLRIRRLGGKIYRINAEMTLHDAALTKFSQFWQRSRRAGYAFAEGAARYGRDPERHWVREQRSGLIWGGAFPALVLLSVPVTQGLSLLLLIAYGITFFRTRRYMLHRGFSKSDASVYSTFCVIGKFAEFSGQCSYWFRRMVGKKSTLIEYKR